MQAVPSNPTGADMLANRLEKNLKHLRRWGKREAVYCYRLYDADIPEYALAIDLYAEADSDQPVWAHVQEYEAPPSIAKELAQSRCKEALDVIANVLRIPQDHVFLKLRKQQKGRGQYEKLSATGRFHTVSEGGLRFLVNFQDYLDTGLFLDHRITRGLLAEAAQGKRFLNLFAYCGSASVYAAMGGATATTTVDLSNTYLDWARRNMELNGFSGGQHEFVQADCLRWLDQQPARNRFDLIFLDPPSFSTSKRMRETLDVQRDHVMLIKKSVALLQPQGLLVFSNNLRRFKMDHAALPELDIKEITRKTIPKDFSRNPRIHNCWDIRAPQ